MGLSRLLSRRKANDDPLPCAKGSDAPATRTLRSGKTYQTLQPVPAPATCAEEHAGGAPSTPACSASACEPLTPALGSCAICWREFGSEVALDSACVVKDSAIDAEEPHMFCVRCISEVCWRHHTAVRKSLFDGSLPPRGPACPKCRFVFSSVLLHPASDLLPSLAPPLHLESPRDPFERSPAARNLTSALATPLADTRAQRGSASVHTREVSVRQLMLATSPRQGAAMGGAGHAVALSSLMVLAERYERLDPHGGGGMHPLDLML